MLVAQTPATSSAELGVQLGLWTLLPFVGMLLAIDLLPLFAGHFWERNRNKGGVAFIVLLLALFAITGGIVVRGSLSWRTRARSFCRCS